jgi:hydrogenase expression/formation protein HypD
MDKKIDYLKSSIYKNKPSGVFNIMEVCGTHTMAISRGGLRQLIPDEVNLISGPGCPVCVTSNEDIDRIIGIIRKYKVTLFTFGDMIRVPGSHSSLQLEKSRGSDIRICYSPEDSLDYAKENPDSKILLVAIGFETTAPLTAVLINRAFRENIKNFYIFNTHKLVPPVLKILLEDPDIKIDSFLCPGHVSAIIGSRPYQFIPDKYGIPCVISGFEPVDIMESIDMLLKQHKYRKPAVQIQYTRVVKPEGNPKALSLINDIFEPCDSSWRGFGILGFSGLKLREKYSAFDAYGSFPVKIVDSREPPGCRCGDVLKGIITPYDCGLFAKKCTPENPIGPCMVSSEGSCAAFYKYNRQHMLK